MRAAPQRAPTAQTGLLVGQQASSYDQQWINFFMGTGRDDLGRTLDEILNRDDHWFESQHDFIQRLFLNSHQSGNGGPTLTPGLKHAFLQSSPLQANLLRCFDRMLTFYGFTWNASRQIVRGRDFDTKPWIRATNRVHNHQRITRILASLKNLGLGSEADAFYNALVNTFGRGAPYAAFVFDDTFSGHWTPALN